MKTTLILTVLLLLTITQGTNAIAATPVDATSSLSATAEPAKGTGSSSHPVPGIISEEDIPAYLRVDPCDTEDS